LLYRRPLRWFQNGLLRDNVPSMKFFAHLSWLLRALLFLAIFAFALMNTDPVTLRFFLGQTWQTPMIVAEPMFSFTNNLRTQGARGDLQWTLDVAAYQPSETFIRLLESALSVQGTEVL